MGEGSSTIEFLEFGKVSPQWNANFIKLSTRLRIVWCHLVFYSIILDKSDGWNY